MDKRSSRVVLPHGIFQGVLELGVDGQVGS